MTVRAREVMQRGSSLMFEFSSSETINPLNSFKSALTNLSIKARIFLGFGLVLTLIALAGAGGIFAMRQIVSDVEISGDMARFLAELQEFSGSLTNFAEKPHEENRALSLSELEGVIKSVDAVMEGAAQSQAKELVAKINGSVNAYFDLSKERDASKFATVKAINDLSASMRNVSKKTQDNIIEAAKNTDEAIQSQTTANETIETIRNVVILIQGLELSIDNYIERPDGANKKAITDIDERLDQGIDQIADIAQGAEMSAQAQAIKATMEKLDSYKKSFLSAELQFGTLSYDARADGEKAENLAKKLSLQISPLFDGQERSIKQAQKAMKNARLDRLSALRNSEEEAIIRDQVGVMTTNFFSWLVNTSDQAQYDILVQSIEELQSQMTLAPEGVKDVMDSRLSDFLNSKQTLEDLMASAQVAHDGMISSAARLSVFVNKLGRQSLSSAREAGEETFVATLIGIAVVIAVCLLVFLYAGNLLRILTAGISRMARGDMDAEGQSANLARRDELGELARAIRSFADKELERERLAQQSAAEQAERAARAERVEALISGFQNTAQDLLSQVAQETGQMEKTAADMSSLAVTARDQTGLAGTASTTAAESVAAVASATEQLSASILDIRRQVEQATGIVNQTSATTEATSTRIDQLAGAAQKIGDVVGLIRDISEQTNLLALNATIEAARAGDAGKGFAVVASEVKSLAAQTGKATEDIAAQIAAIQAETNGAVTAIQSIVGAMAEVNTATAAIASSVEQQAGATSEISSNVQRASGSTGSASESMGAVSESVEQTARASGLVQNSATQVAKRTDDLRDSVKEFLEKVQES